MTVSFDALYVFVYLSFVSQAVRQQVWQTLLWILCLDLRRSRVGIIYT